MDMLESETPVIAALPLYISGDHLGWASGLLSQTQLPAFGAKDQLTITTLAVLKH